MSKITGLVTTVGRQKSGTNQKGPWTVQHIIVDDNQNSYDVSVWNRPDLLGFRGQTVVIDGVTNNAKGELQLKSGDGEITSIPNSATPGRTSAIPPLRPPGKIPLGSYLSIQAEVMKEVTREFKTHLGSDFPGDAFGAIGSLVEQVMFAIREGKIEIGTYGSSDTPL